MQHFAISALQLSKNHFEMFDFSVKMNVVPDVCGIAKQRKIDLCNGNIT